MKAFRKCSNPEEGEGGGQKATMVITSEKKLLPKFDSLYKTLYMKVGQHYHSTISKIRTRAFGALTVLVFNPDPSQLSFKFLKKTYPSQKLS